jgi:hypothetical protein
MALQNSALTSLEIAVLDFICKTIHEDGLALRGQLATASIRSRENTGHGFYTHFEVDHAIAGIGGHKSRDMRDGPLAKVDGIEHGMGFILWLHDGYANHLEGYSFGGSTVDIDFATVAFELWTPEINNRSQN